MKKHLLILLTATSPLLCATHWFAGTAPDRHKEMREHFSKPQPKEKLPWYQWKYMTGDWNGNRSSLAKNGVTFSGSFFTDCLGNPIGGRARGFEYAGSLGVDMNIDFEKTTKLKGLEFYIAAVSRSGSNLSSKKIGNQFPVAQLYGGQNVRLNQAYFKQTLFDGDLMIKLGRIEAGDNFLQSPLYYNFVSNAFDGNPIGVFFNVPFTAYPNSTWGAYLQFSPIKRVLAKLAVYNANANVNRNSYHGFNLSFKNTDGAQIIGELGYILNQEPEDTGLPGTYKLGSYVTTKSTDKFLGGSASNNYGVYLQLDQMIYRREGTKDQGLTPFAALLFAPKDRNEFPFFFTAGFVFKGLFPSRPGDKTNLGVAYGTYSSDRRELQYMAKNLNMTGAFGNIPQNYEMVLELNHWVSFSPWFKFTPDVQYIIKPSGNKDISNALVLGAQIGLIF